MSTEAGGRVDLDAFPARSRGSVSVPAGPLRFEPSIRPDGRIRILTRLPPDLARPYTAAARGLARTIEGRLSEAVVANRGRPWSPGLVEPWSVARRRLRRRLRAITPPDGRATIVRSDVLSCYPAIGPAAVAAALPAGDPRTLRLVRALGRIHARGGTGLPIGPAASAIVANAVLAAGDAAIAGTGARHVRWVDDVVILADGRRHAWRAFDAWRAALATAGLEANPAKTTIGAGPGELPTWARSPLGAAHDVR
jgi:hypothetical protein